MTAQEKAKQLIRKYMKIETDFSYDGGYTFEKLTSSDAKQFALVSVDDIIDQIFDFQYYSEVEEAGNYWQAVRTEIEKL